jgi:polysaccharide deacetylase family protein (PEP-CTERM system associated)
VTPQVENVFSVDVEDWFHILDIEEGVPPEAWQDQESRVEENTRRLLGLLRRHDTHATWFVLGWIAERYPALVKEIHREGHEIATHGFGHGLIYEQTPDVFRADVERSIQAIEGITLVRPRGYRAPGFSLTTQSLWALSVLSSLGLSYDSSLFPARRGHGGLPGSNPLPHRIDLDDERRLVELPIATTSLCGRRIAYCGGGYLRLLPLAFIRRMIRRSNAEGIPVVLYIHPRDIDPDQPRMPLPVARRFKSYVGLRKTYDKVSALLEEFPFGTAAGLLESVSIDELPGVRISSDFLEQV